MAMNWLHYIIMPPLPFLFRYNNEKFIGACTEEYLKERTEFRNNGKGLHIEDKRKKINIEDLKENIDNKDKWT